MLLSIYFRWAWAFLTGMGHRKINTIFLLFCFLSLNLKSNIVNFIEPENQEKENKFKQGPGKAQLNYNYSKYMEKEVI